MNLLNLATSTLAALVSSAASAAMIDWGSQSYVNCPAGSKSLMGIDQFEQSGQQIFAVSTGFLSGRLEQKNDIVFADSDPNLDTTSMANNFTDYHASTGGNNEISRSGLYSDGGPAVVTISRLEIGSTYRIQNFIYDGRAPHNGRTLEVDGIPMVSHANAGADSTWGDGSLSTGVFVADGVTQSFTIEVFNPSGSSAGGQLNAILLHKTVAAPGVSAQFLDKGGPSDHLAGEFEAEKFKVLLRLNRRYAEKAEKLKKKAMEKGDLGAANAADRQVKRYVLRAEKLVGDRDKAVLIASLAGDWSLRSTGWSFKIFADGSVTASEPISESGRIEVIDYEKRTVRMTGFARPMTWVVGKGSKSLLGTKHPARRVGKKAVPAPTNARELAEYLDGTTWNWRTRSRRRLR